MNAITVRAGSTRLTLENLRKQYGPVQALDDLSLTVEPGTFQALLGPSGSGKTTVLTSVAGFLPLDSGRIMVNGRDISALPPEKRNFGMVFQGYALFPHLTVLDNVAFSLRARGVSKAERYKRAGTAIDMVRLSGLENRLPRQLSGGQQQRVALARAIAFGPDLLLLDEPLSALDRALRGELQSELRELQRTTGFTCVYVTHDQDEALSMANEVAVLTRGRIMQSGSPSELYEKPTSRFVASFLGKSNFFDLEVGAADGDFTVCRRGNHTFFHKRADGGAAMPAGSRLLLALRPEKFRLAGSTDIGGKENTVAGRVTDISYLGSVFEIAAEAEGLGKLILKVPPADAANIRIGDDIRVYWSPDATVEVSPDA